MSAPELRSVGKGLHGGPTYAPWGPLRIPRTAPCDASSNESGGALARRAVDSLGAMMAYWDADQRCRFANKEYERWFGVDPDALIGRHLHELLGPLYDLNLPHIEGVLRGEAQQFERDIPDPAGGAPRRGLATYTPDVVDGVVRGFFVLVTDIASVKEAQNALAESEERFRLTFDEAPIGMALVGTDGRFLRVNGALCELFGYSPQELACMDFQTITHPADLDVDLALAGRLARGEIPRYTLDKRYVRKDGTIVHAKLSGSAVRDADGKLLHFIAQVQDVSAAWRHEEEQSFLAALGPELQSTLEADAILDHVLDLATPRIAEACAIVLTDAQGKVVRKCAAGHDGRTASPHSQVPADGAPAAHVAAALETATTGGAIVRMVPAATGTAAGAVASLHAVPLMLGNRRLGGLALVGASRGPTPEPDDQRFVEEFAWRIAVALENARLYAQARRASDIRDEVLAIVAHDLRNPLGTIVTQAALLRRRAQPRAGAEGTAGEVIQRAADRMKRLIQDLLDAGRMEAGALSVDRRAVDPAALLESCLQSQRQLADAAGIDLRPDFTPPLAAVWADHDRMLQVLENLIGNALKFTPRNGRVTVGALTRQRDVLFWVRDDGAGIDPEQVPHVFERFWQAGRSQRQGAGLGLPIAKGIVEAHGGRIRVESRPGLGTCFMFTIPLAVPQSDPAHG